MDISFIIPCLNEEFHLPRILHSIVTSCYNVSYEIIVVDNGSTDNSMNIAIKMGAIVITGDGLNISGLRNSGANNANGRIFVFLDADVLITKDWGVAIQYVIREVAINYKIVTGARLYVSSTPCWLEKVWFEPMIMASNTNYINSGHLIVTKKFFWEIKGFDPALITGEDYDFCMRARDHGGVIINNKELVAIHEGYPKNLRDFMRREVWHGTQDFKSWNSFVHSKPAILSVLYGGGLLTGVIFALSNGRLLFLFWSVLHMLTISFLATLHKRHVGIKLHLVYGTIIYNFYLVARLLSLFKAIKFKKFDFNVYFKN